jgi:peptidoglycan/LPS O-acetylase OafA/YrhL
MAHLSFRHDINGLRAYAVLAVILFHFGIAGFTGGYVGVDVFFVISGYLMTAIILDRLERGQFSVIAFYAMRARRLVPALAALCIFATVAGWFALSPMQYVTHARSAIAALLFSSNFLFWRESGYFDSTAHDNLLLHTWSLSVEWQFYLIFPLILLAAWRLRANRTAVAAILAGSGVLSYCACVIVTQYKPIPAFYLLPTRAWELLAGGLVFVYGGMAATLQPRIRRAMELAGFGLIFFGVCAFDSATTWPGWRAAVPVAGSALVILAARQESALTRNSIAQWVGSTSYSIYLWHWPLRVLLGVYGREDSGVDIAGMLLLTALMGHVSFVYIEKGAAHFVSSASRWNAVGVSTAVLIAAVALPAAILASGGVPSRFSPAAQAVFAQANQKNRYVPCSTEVTSHCSVSYRDFRAAADGSRLGAIVIGDSHAAALLRAIESALPAERSKVLFFTHFACPTIAGIRQLFDVENTCDQLVRSAMEMTASIPASVPLIIINRTSYYFHGFNESRGGQAPLYYRTKSYAARTQEYYREIGQGVTDTACEFAKTRLVYFVRPVPEMLTSVPNAMGRALVRGTPQRISVSLAEYYERNKLALESEAKAASGCGVRLLDPVPYLCSSDACWGDIDGHPLYSDSNHLNTAGSALLIPMFSSIRTISQEEPHVDSDHY